MKNIPPLAGWPTEVQSIHAPHLTSRKKKRHLTRHLKQTKKRKG
jgi:hypothetical protein